MAFLWGHKKRARRSLSGWADKRASRELPATCIVVQLSPWRIRKMKDSALCFKTPINVESPLSFRLRGAPVHLNYSITLGENQYAIPPKKYETVSNARPRPSLVYCNFYHGVLEA